jgi:Leucine-rich repeat (LRR) protein
MNKIILIIVIILVFLAISAASVFLGQNKDIFAPATTNTQPGNSQAIFANKILDLSNNGLTSLSQSIFNQTNLEELNVSHNFLTGAMPAEIRKLQNLKILNASYNQMTGVPAEVGQLQKLETLDLSYNQLTGLPNELGNLQNLKTLNLTGNQYSQQDLDYIRNKLPATVNIIVN